MTIKKTVKALLAEARRPVERAAARREWAERTTEAWHQAMRQMTDRCTEAVERLSEEEFDKLYEAEQAKVDALWAQLRAVVDKDMWPRELYFGCV